jgi:hypothetical protein
MNFQLPLDVLTGCYVPIAVLTADQRVSNFVTISIASKGGACSDSLGLSGNDLLLLQHQGNLSVGVVAIHSITSGPGGTGLAPVVTTDSADALFFEYDLDTFAKTQGVFRAPTIGGCEVFTGGGSGAVPADPFSGTPLDAGPSITLRGANALSTELMQIQKGSYGAMLPDDPFGSPGEYAISSPGGAQVGSFSALLKTAPILAWTNATQITTVHESAGQLVTWTGSDLTGTVQIIGASGPGSQGPFASASFVCTAPAAAQRFLIPPAVLLVLPPSIMGGNPPGTMAIRSQGLLQRFAVPSLDVAFGLATNETTQHVIYSKQ